MDQMKVKGSRVPKTGTRDTLRVVRAEGCDLWREQFIIDFCFTCQADTVNLDRLRRLLNQGRGFPLLFSYSQNDKVG
jgi:hypothetical protein